MVLMSNYIIIVIVIYSDSNSYTQTHKIYSKFFQKE